MKKIFVRGDGFTKAYFKEINTPEMMNYSISNDNLSSRADSDALARERQTYREGVENKKIDVTAFLSVKRGLPSGLTLTKGGAVQATAELLVSVTKKDETKPYIALQNNMPTIINMNRGEKRNISARIFETTSSIMRKRS